MSEEMPVLWIKTRDGSPTLWSNELSEPFRSTKGAFSESWAAFVCPALAYIEEQNFVSVVAGEFGLGPGTNWLLLSLTCAYLDKELDYYVIEKDLSFFKKGLEKWAEILPEAHKFIASHLSSYLGLKIDPKDFFLDKLKKPHVYASVDDALDNHQKEKGMNLWFHDPFGYAVNPDGYSYETIEKCSRLWSPKMAGFSYASNRHFKDSLEGLDNVKALVQDTSSGGLKRNRLEFYRQ